MHDADELATQHMAGFARWTNLRETRSCPPTEEPVDYQVRIFTCPRRNPVCRPSHAPIGPCPDVRHAAPLRTPKCLVLQCGAGPVRVRRDGTRLAFAAPPLIRGGEGRGRGLMEITAILSIDRDQVVDVPWADNGPG